MEVVDNGSTQSWNYRLVIDSVILYLALSNIDSSLLLNYRFSTLRLELSMALFSTFLLSNIDSSLLFNYRFPILDLLHLIENVFTLTPALTLTLPLKRNYVFGLTK